MNLYKALRGQFSRIKLGGTLIEATAAEINKLGSVAAGVASASKAVVLGSSKELAGHNEAVVTKGANYSVVAADSHKRILVTAADLVISLPATVAGLRICVQLAAAGLSGGTGLSISPAAADKIMGNGLTSADNKDIILEGATDREGDYVELVGDGADGWYITGISGTWAREG